MYYIELHYTNGETVRLPEPYVLYMEAYRAMLERYPTCSQLLDKNVL